ncbi:MAG: glycoside hydrolase family 15 protein [Actinobacteria bacterium]|nr:MAG: glycoside hydrolase family 15 protein [Actinomycetota bacterium]
MARIEDYALIGDLQTAALVSRCGSVDWLCFPRFDSGACFAALLGGEENGRWVIEPAGPFQSVRRRYRDDTLVLETDWETTDGAVRVIDFMPPRESAPDIVRIVEGISGRVEMRTELVIRFDYGSIVPWVRRMDGNARIAVGGPDALCLRTPIDVRGEDLRTLGELTVEEGDRIPFTLTWFPSHGEWLQEIDPEQALRDTTDYWNEFNAHCGYEGQWRTTVQRSLMVLKALTYAPTGGIVAAPTTSLPEHIGGVRNWDYRYCWLRDATLTLLAFLNGGYVEEARDWRQWLLRAAAGDPADLQIMYGVGGERRLTELELEWLDGYEGSRPVRLGNDASRQFQLDVYGEVLDALYQARTHGLPTEAPAWALQRKMLDHLERVWREPDEGIWEVRGPRRHFTHSKVMCWVAFDRAVRTVASHDLEGRVERWTHIRDEIHDEICRRAYDPKLAAFTQSYGSQALDASVLLMPLVGFLPASDERVQGTVDAIQRTLMRDGLVLRYLTDDEAIDGLPAGEGVFLPCSFWLVDCLELMGRHDEAHALFERLAGLANDVGLIAEEYDPDERRLLGNFPQAFTHLALVNSAFNLALHHPPMKRRHADGG